MLLEIAIVYCLASDPTSCIERRHPWFRSFGLPIGCVVQAQQEAVTYLQEHPKYKLHSWGCRVENRRSRPA